MKTLDDLLKTRDSLATAQRGLAPSVRDSIFHAFGIEAFRPLQEPALAAALTGRDSLVVMPTGSGKSLCFQAPALFSDGLTVVVSPLISLMKDQVDKQLGRRGTEAGPLAGQIAYLNSSLHARDQLGVEQALRRGKYRLLYVAPERFNDPTFLGLLARCRVGSIAVDEAHCISQWGHNFRPAYAKLGELRSFFPKAALHAYTATATPRVREEIVESLMLRDPEILVGDFDRPNLTLRVVPRLAGRTGQIRDVANEILSRVGIGSVIVYCMTRRETEQIAEGIAAFPVDALPYHAGLDADTRTHNQEAFMSGDCDVIVATTAFGMGIDKPDVRAVIHASMPSSLEQYHQEIGRAGRDGKPAECVLLDDPDDFDRWIRVMEIEDEVERFRAQLRVGPMPARVPAYDRLCAVDFYCSLDVDCRRQDLLEHFGQKHPGHCNACDVCLGGEA